jgi:hypothetical protein
MRLSVALVALATLAAAFPAQVPFASSFDSLLSDSERFILAGKSNLERWIHNGQQFIKHSGQMCKRITIFSFVLYPRNKYGLTTSIQLSS